MATITITPGNSFTATETVTSTKLNDLGSPTAALTAASIGTADIADDAITPALIADDAVTTPAILDANVTFAKLTDVIDDDTMATATDTTLATSESIKAYVDEYAMKYSGATGTTSVTTSFADLDLSSVVGANRTMVILELWDASTNASLMLRPKGSVFETRGSYSNSGYGASGLFVSTTSKGGTAVLTTDASGVIEIKGDNAASGINYKIQAYQKLA
jgi:hypothetical protein